MIQQIIGKIKFAILVMANLVMVGLIAGQDAIVSALSIASMTPASGTIKGGNWVTIKGSGFAKTATEKFADLAAGVEHVLMLSTNGHVWAAGQNNYGQLGTGKLPTSYEITPRDITPSMNLDGNDRIVAVATGDYSSYAVSAKHRVFAWGNNNYGQLGNGNRINQTKPVDITANFNLPAGEYVTSVASGVATAFAVTNGGQVYVWGSRQERMDGQAHTEYGSHERPVLANWLGADIRQVAAGNRAAVSVDASGRVTTWGVNSHGELGRSQPGSANNVSEYEGGYWMDDNLQLNSDDQVISVAAGNGVMAALTKYHQVYVWGDDRNGLLGLGGEMPNPHDSTTGSQLSSTPINITKQFAVPERDYIDQISIGNSQVMALSQTGQTFVWGLGNFGQLGLGAEVASADKPTDLTGAFQLSDNTMIQKVVASGVADNAVASYSYALDTDGNVYAWGGSAKGLPGINAIANLNRWTPNRISDRLTTEVSNVASISFGEAPATVYSVPADETIKVLVPAMDTAGPVTVTVTDSAGDSVIVPQQYTYTSNAPNDKLPDDDKPSNSDKDKDAPSDDNNDTGKDKDKTGQANQDGGNKAGDLSKQLGSSDSNSSSRLNRTSSTSAAARAGSNVKAPNTGF